MSSAIRVLTAYSKSLCLQPLKAYVTIYSLHETDIQRLHVCAMKRFPRKRSNTNTTRSLTQDLVTKLAKCNQTASAELAAKMKVCHIYEKAHRPSLQSIYETRDLASLCTEDWCPPGY